MRRWLRLFVPAGVAGLVIGFLSAPAASAQQSVNFYMGGFVPTSADARGDIAGGISNDVLVQNQQFLSFRIKDFDGFTFGGEWLVPMRAAISLEASAMTCWYRTSSFFPSA